MTAADLALIVAVVLCSIGFAALVVVLLRVLDALGQLRADIAALRRETEPLLTEMRTTTAAARETMDTARSDLERFDRVLGSAEAVSDAVNESSRAARKLFSVPVIKAAGVAAGVRRTGQRLRGTSQRVELVEVIDVSEAQEDRRA